MKGGSRRQSHPITAYCQLTNFLHKVYLLLKPSVPEVEESSCPQLLQIAFYELYPLKIVASIFAE